MMENTVEVNETPVKKSRGRPKLSQEEKDKRKLEKMNKKEVVLDENGNPVKKSRGRPKLSQEEKDKRELKTKKTTVKRTTKEKNKEKNYAVLDSGLGKMFEVNKVVFVNENGDVVEERIFKNEIIINHNKIGTKIMDKNNNKYVVIDIDDERKDFTLIVKKID